MSYPSQTRQEQYNRHQSRTSKPTTQVKPNRHKKKKQRTKPQPTHSNKLKNYSRHSPHSVSNKKYQNKYQYHQSHPSQRQRPSQHSYDAKLQYEQQLHYQSKHKQQQQHNQYHLLPPNQYNQHKSKQQYQYQIQYNQNHQKYRQMTAPQLQSHQNDGYYRPHTQHSQHQHQHQHLPRSQMTHEQQIAYQKYQYYLQQQRAQRNRQNQNQNQNPHDNKRSRPKSYKNPSIEIKKVKNKSEKTLLNCSCSLPEDDELLRATVNLLEDDAGIYDGYSSDNTLMYGKITINKKQSNKTKYLQKLGKEILSNKLKNPNDKNEKNELALKSGFDLNGSIPTQTLYKKIKKRLNDHDNEYEILSDNSEEKEKRAEKQRKKVIHARQRMRRHRRKEKASIFFKYGSIPTVLCNLTASTLGCSVLCIPYIFSLAGWLYGAINIFVIVILQLISMRLLLQCQKCTGVRSIQQLTILYLKNKFGILFINSVIFGYCFTQCIAILIAIADLIQPVLDDYLDDSFLSNRTFLLIIITLFILLPLSFKDKPLHLKQEQIYNKRIAKKRNKIKRKRRIHSYENINRLSDTLYNICMIYFLFAICASCLDRWLNDNNDHKSFDTEGIHTGIHIDSTTTAWNQFYSLTLGWCVILYSLTTHIELFRVNEKLISDNKHHLNGIVHGALIQHTIYILILGTCGYFYFSNNPCVYTNVILNLKDNTTNYLILISMFVIGCAMFIFYPIVLQPSRHSISILLFPSSKINIQQHITLTILVDIFALIFALFITDLTALFAWSGSIFATILCLILPSLLFWNIIVNPSKEFISAMIEHERELENKKKKLKNKKRKISYLNIDQTGLTSIIATATPPLMNYARSVDRQTTDDKSSLLSGGSTQLSSNTTNTNTNIVSSLPNIMTPDSFNQLILDSHVRLYGNGGFNKKLLAQVDEKYNNSDDDDDKSDSLSISISSDNSDLTQNTNTEFVSLSSQKHNLESYTDRAILEEFNGDGDGDLEEEEEPMNGTGDKISSSPWWKPKPIKPFNAMKILQKNTNYFENRYNKKISSKKRESSVSGISRTITSRTGNLKESSQIIQQKIEQQLNQEKLQRIKTLEKVNQSWTFWFDRIGAIFLFAAGITLFIVGNLSNIAHIVDAHVK